MKMEMNFSVGATAKAPVEAFFPVELKRLIAENDHAADIDKVAASG